jgi:uncharacterized protein YaeQ
MALKPTIYKALIDISDIDRGYYESHSITVACHPSETEERMMIRILAFACNAHERLKFGADLCNTEEPALLRDDLTGAIEQWIEIGQPDARRILKACGRAREVIVYSYGRSAENWWSQNAPLVERAENLSAYRITEQSSASVARLAERTMKLHCMIQDGDVTIGNEREDVSVELISLKKTC